MEGIFGFLKRKLHVTNDEAMAQVKTEGLPEHDVVNDFTLEFSPGAGHGGYYPPVKGLSAVENHTTSSRVTQKQLEESPHQNIGRFPLGK